MTANGERTPTSAASAGRIFCTPDGCALEVRDVWASNLDQEMEIIRDLIDQQQLQHIAIQVTVMVFELPQLLIKLTDDERNNIPGGSCWQFNFKLKPSAIGDFERFDHNENGIDGECFGELLMTSGLVFNDAIRWISFQSKHSIATVCSAIDLPCDVAAMLQTVATFVISVLDAKVQTISESDHQHSLPAALPVAGQGVSSSSVGVPKMIGTDPIEAKKELIHWKSLLDCFQPSFTMRCLKYCPSHFSIPHLLGIGFEAQLRTCKSSPRIAEAIDVVVEKLLSFMNADNAHVRMVLEFLSHHRALGDVGQWYGRIVQGIVCKWFDRFRYRCDRISAAGVRLGDAHRFDEIYDGVEDFMRHSTLLRVPVHVRNGPNMCPFALAGGLSPEQAKEFEVSVFGARRPGFVRLFHGTTVASVRSILFGVRAQAGRRECDFWNAFYLTYDIAPACWYASMRIGDDDSAILAFEFAEHVVEQWPILEDHEWPEVVMECYGGHVNRLRRDLREKCDSAVALRGRITNLPNAIKAQMASHGRESFAEGMSRSDDLASPLWQVAWKQRRCGRG